MSFEPGVAPPAVLSARPLVFACAGGAVLCRREPPGAAALPAAALLPTLDEAIGLGLDPAQAHHLGALDGQDCLALPLRPPGEPDEPAGFERVSLRKLWGRFDEALFAVAGRATQVIDWAAAHQFCGRCATPTVRDPGERCLACPGCGLRSYPRISPAIIVLVRRGRQALLARSARFPLAFYSTLAGFVEIGESLEDTLHREVREEVGVEVTNLRYFGSQPWPFPHSLMLGFHADHAGGEIAIDHHEIDDARWFSADDLPAIPPRISIARRLIDAWVDEVGGRPG